MKKLLAVVLAAVMLMVLGAAAYAESGEAEWDASVSTEVTEEVQTAFDQAMEGLVGVNYDPVAVLGQQGDTWCVLCKATVVYPNAKPYNALYISAAQRTKQRSGRSKSFSSIPKPGRKRPKSGSTMGQASFTARKRWMMRSP